MLKRLVVDDTLGKNYHIECHVLGALCFLVTNSEKYQTMYLFTYTASWILPTANVGNFFTIISQYYCVHCIFVPINVAMVIIREFKDINILNKLYLLT